MRRPAPDSRPPGRRHSEVPAKHYDVVVVGAGPAGSATALRLAKAGCRVLLVERSHFDQFRVGESLAPSVQPLLRELGVWRQFEALRPCPSWGTRSLWGGDLAEVHSHMLSAYGCGWHVDRLRFDRMLARAAVRAGACLHLGATLAGCERQNDLGAWRLRLHRERPALPEGSLPRWTPSPETLIVADMLVDASGRSASLARSLGAQRSVFDRLIGAATQWRADEVHAVAGPSPEGFVLVEAAPGGWWYSAPVPAEEARDTLVGMLFTDADLCGRHDLTDGERWRGALEDAPATSARLLGQGSLRPRWGPRLFLPSASGSVAVNSAAPGCRWATPPCRSIRSRAAAW